MNHDNFQVLGLGNWEIMEPHSLGENRSSLRVEKIMGQLCAWCV